MEALLQRLSAFDADAEAAVRVIGFFDRLVGHRADLTALLRSTAALAECTVGAEIPGRGISVRMHPPGRRGAAPTATRVATAEIREGDDPIGECWLERPGPAHPLDPIIAERLAGALSVLADLVEGPVGDDLELLATALSATRSEQERLDACRRLGLVTGRPLRVLVADGEPAPNVTFRRELTTVDGPAWSRPEKDGQVVVVALARTVDAKLASVAGHRRVGAGPAVAAADLPDSLGGARTAFRLTVAYPQDSPVARYDDLGAIRLLEELPPHAARAEPDVLALSRIAAGPQGAQRIATLRAWVRARTLRVAGEELHLHHSSVAHRLDGLAADLGFELDSPLGRIRLALALATYQLHCPPDR